MDQPISAGVTCHSCGKDALYVGKLPAVGLHAAVHVFKCETCLIIRSTPATVPEPGRSLRGDRAIFR